MLSVNMLIVVMLSVVMLSVVMLSVVMLNVVAPIFHSQGVFRPYVVRANVTAQIVKMNKVY